jgi:hypothetical protein
MKTDTYPPTIFMEAALEAFVEANSLRHHTIATRIE